MNEKKIRIAVIGSGAWGKNLIRVASGLGLLGAFCDSNGQALKELKKIYPHIPYFKSYIDILKDKSMGAVIISTPSQSHYHIAKDALSAGKDVFVEKPMALTFRDGAELVKLAERKNRILMVGHLLEYHPAILALKKLLDRGDLGKVKYIYSNRLNLGKVRKEENVLWSFAPHDISAMLFLLNEIPKTVSAVGENYLRSDIADVTLSTLNFSDGIKGHIFVSWLHPYKEQKFIVAGSKKMAVFDDVSENEKLLIFKHKIDWVNKRGILKKEKSEKVELDMKEPLVLEIEHFVDCIRKRKTPRTSGKGALRVLKVLEACQISLKKGGAVVSLDSLSESLKYSNGYYAHPTSVIEEPCRIGKGTKIWHYSHIMKGSKVGTGCNIGQNVFIASKAVLGDNVKVQNNVSIYDGVKLEDDVFCGPSVVFTNVINPRSHISRKKEYKKTIVKKGATIGANATIICGVTIGEYAFIGAGAVVTKDVKPHALVYGNPAVFKGWVCSCGAKLKSKGDKTVCSACNKIYKFH